MRTRLELEKQAAESAASRVDAVVLADPATGGTSLAASNNEATIMRYAILNGALEILPGTLATMAVVPLQSKLPEIQASAQSIDPSKIMEIVRGK